MKKLITILSLAFLVSCSASTAPEEEEKTYPYVAKTFHVDTPIHAEWRGVTAKIRRSNGDTTHITQPGQMSLELDAHPNLVSGFTMTIEDTSIQQGETHPVRSKFTFSDSTFFGHESGHQGIGASFWQDGNTGKEFLRLRANFSYRCGSDFDDSRITLTIPRPDSTIYAIYEFHTDGFETAAADMSGCE